MNSGTMSAASKHGSSGAFAGPRLGWPSRTWVVGELMKEPFCESMRLKLLERHSPVSASGGAPNRLIRGDSLDVARALIEGGLGGKVDLVYADPPFASQSSYSSETRLDGPADGRVRRVRAFDDSWPAHRAVLGSEGEDGVGAYLDMLGPRLEAMATLLAPTGTLWVHVDWRAAYLVRVLLDEIMGRGAFKNEIVWRRAPNLGRQAASGQFGRTLDTIVVYGGPAARLVPPTRKEPIAPSAIRRDAEGRPFTTAPRGDYSEASMDRLAAEGRVHTTASGRRYVKYFLEPNAAGELCRERRLDTLWTDVPPLRHARPTERTGFPTQKPLALLERIVAAATPEGGVVVDLFAGSGTTGEAAHALGRSFILGDRGPVALNVMRARLLRAKAPFTIEALAVAAPPAPASPPKVRATRVDRVDLRVELLEPLEPLAWAIGRVAAPSQPFVAEWHSERLPATRPRPAAREVILPGGAEGGPFAACVYEDDGAISHLPLTIGDES